MDALLTKKRISLISPCNAIGERTHPNQTVQTFFLKRSAEKMVLKFGNENLLRMTNVHQSI